MFHFGGMRLPFLIIACLIFLDGLARMFLLQEPKKDIESKKQNVPAWKAFLNLLKDPQIVFVSGSSFIGNGGISVMELLTPLYFASLNYSALVIGFIYCNICTEINYNSGNNCFIYCMCPNRWKQVWC